MKKSYSKLLLLMVAMLTPVLLSAQLRLIDVDFEEGIPSDWTQEQVYGTASWSLQTGGDALVLRLLSWVL